MPEKVIKALNLKDGQAVAVIGSGTGYFTVRFARAHPKVQVIGSERRWSRTFAIARRRKR